LRTPNLRGSVVIFFLFLFFLFFSFFIF
jgi:hypothetical protein